MGCKDIRFFILSNFYKPYNQVFSAVLISILCFFNAILQFERTFFDKGQAAICFGMVLIMPG